MEGHLFRDLTPPPSFASAKLAAALSSWLSVPVFAALLVPVAWRFSQLRRESGAKSARKRRIVFWMMVNLISSLARSSVNVFVHSALGSDPGLCRVGQRHAVVQFALSTWAGYWVLLRRAEGTLDRSSRLHMFVYKQSKLTLTVGVPLLMVVAVVLCDGQVLFGNACTQNPSAIVAMIFMFLDLNVTVYLVSLFYIPVRRHVNRAKRNHCDKTRAEATHMHRMARRALRLSLFQQTIMFVAQLFNVVTQFLADDLTNPEYTYLRGVRWVIFAVSLFINTLTMLAMSPAWLPPKWHWWRRVATARGAYACVTVMLVLLFYIPVRRHIRRVKQVDCGTIQAEASRMHGTARRALRLSLVQQTSMFAVQLFGVATQFLANDATNPNVAYLRCVRWTAFAASLVINTVAMLAMTPAWLPPKWLWWRRVVWATLCPPENASSATTATVAPSFKRAVRDTAQTVPVSSTAPTKT